MNDINGLDRIDLRLLSLLQRDASLSNLEVAERVGLSPTPCARRIKRLLSEGFIQRQVVILDQEKLGLDLTVHDLPIQPRPLFAAQALSNTGALSTKARP